MQTKVVNLVEILRCWHRVLFVHFFLVFRFSFFSNFEENLIN